jgi:hypothetical protein
MIIARRRLPTVVLLDQRAHSETGIDGILRPMLQPEIALQALPNRLPMGDDRSALRARWGQSSEKIAKALGDGSGCAHEPSFEFLPFSIISPWTTLDQALAPLYPYSETDRRPLAS